MNLTYPIYQIDEHGLYAFVAKDKMFMVTNSHGSNPKNDGMVVDYYITERMVKKHYSFGRKGIQKEEFIKLFTKLTAGILDKIINY